MAGVNAKVLASIINKIASVKNPIFAKCIFDAMDSVTKSYLATHDHLHYPSTEHLIFLSKSVFSQLVGHHETFHGAEILASDIEEANKILEWFVLYLTKQSFIDA